MLPLSCKGTRNADHKSFMGLKVLCSIHVGFSTISRANLVLKNLPFLAHWIHTNTATTTQEPRGAQIQETGQFIHPAAQARCSSPTSLMTRASIFPMPTDHSHPKILKAIKLYAELSALLHSGNPDTY